MFMRAPTIVRMLESAVKAWWDDDALRLGASPYTPLCVGHTARATAIAGWSRRRAVRGKLRQRDTSLREVRVGIVVQSILDGASQRRKGISHRAWQKNFVVAAQGISNSGS